MHTPAGDRAFETLEHEHVRQPHHSARGSPRAGAFSRRCTSSRPTCMAFMLISWVATRLSASEMGPRKAEAASVSALRGHRAGAWCRQCWCSSSSKQVGEKELANVTQEGPAKADQTSLSCRLGSECIGTLRGRHYPEGASTQAQVDIAGMTACCHGFPGPRRQPRHFACVMRLALHRRSCQRRTSRLTAQQRHARAAPGGRAR